MQRLKTFEKVHEESKWPKECKKENTTKKSPEYEGIFIDGFHFGADVDFGTSPTQDDPGEEGGILAVYIENEEGDYEELKDWGKNIEDALIAYFFDHDRYEKQYGPKSCG